MPYPLNTVWTEDIVNFVKDFNAGKLQPSIMSDPEPAPEDLVKDGLTTIVGTTWSKIVHDPSKDVVVHICHIEEEDYCPIMRKHFNRVAKELEDVEDLVMAYFEYSTNEITGIALSEELPLVKLFPKAEEKDV